MNEKIGVFCLDKSKTTMKYGRHYKALLDVPFDEEKRYIRVWLPEDYDYNDKNKRFPVIYFSDGQNLVNRYLTAFGDWNLDKVAHRLYKEKGISFIAVGIDSPRDDLKRFLELNPDIKPDKVKDIDNPYGDKFINYIADELKPLIDNCFFTKPEREQTAIGGSSMGGIMAFYGAVIRNESFGFSLDFSPAFLNYTLSYWKQLLKSFELNKKLNTKFFLYVGGKEFEKEFVSHTLLTYKYMVKQGFTPDNLAVIYDSQMIHHEDAWNKYLYDALYFWLKG